MKLHLPKALLLTVVFACFACDKADAALTFTTNLAETATVYDTSANFTGGGFSYDANTGIITYYANTQTKFDSTITLNYTNFKALTEKADLVKINTTNDKGSWGIRATADAQVIGILKDGSDRTDGNPMAADTLADYATTVQTGGQSVQVIEGMTVLIDATLSNGNGVQVKVPDSTKESGTANVYYDTGLKYTPGYIGSVALNKNLISSVSIKEVTSHTLTIGNLTKTYAANAKIAFDQLSSTEADATIISSSAVIVEGGKSTKATNLAKGGDIIIGGSGRLDLNTWVKQPVADQGAIALDNDIYLGSTTDAQGSLRLEAYSGSINLNGTVTVTEDALIRKQGEKSGNNYQVTFGGAVTDGTGDNCTLTLQGYGEPNQSKKFDYVTFSGSVDLGGLTMAGAEGSDVTFSNVVQVGTLTTQDGAHKLTFNGATELGTISMGTGSTLELAGTGKVSLGGGALVGAISNTNANLSISGNITHSAFTATENYTDGANGYMVADTITLIDNSGSGTTTGSWNLIVDGASCTSSIDANGDVVVQFGEGNTGYYVTEELEYTGNVAAAKDIVLKGGTLLLNSTLKEGATIYSTAAAPSTIKLGANQTLANSSVSKAGGGTTTLNSANTTAVYTLDAAGAENPALNVTLGEDWTGTVHLKDVTMKALNFDNYANSTNVANSTILLDGVKGYARNGGTFTYNTNIKLADDNENALVFNNGNNNDHHIFTGKVSGSGHIKRDTATGTFQYYTFKGDVSEWTGAFVWTPDKAGAGTSVTFSENAKTIKADFTQTGADGQLNVMVDNAEAVSMTGTVSATQGAIKLQNLGAGKVTVAHVSANGGNVQLSGNGSNAIDIANLSIKAGNTVSDGCTIAKPNNTITTTDDASVTVTVTEKLSIASGNAIALQGALVLGAGIEISLTGFQVEEGVTSYTLGTAGSISFAGGVDFLEGTGIKGYTAKLTIGSMVNEAMPADGEATPTTTQSLVLTLTANKPTLTEITINGGSYADGVLTLTTETDIANVVFGNKLNAIMDDTTWEAILNATTTLPDKVLVSITDGQNYIDFDTNDDGTIDTALTINGEGITGTPVVGGIEVNGTPNKGTIVGNYVTAYIPEPTTTTLSLLALAGLAVRRRRASR